MRHSPSSPSSSGGFPRPAAPAILAVLALVAGLPSPVRAKEPSAPETAAGKTGQDLRPDAKPGKFEGNTLTLPTMAEGAPQENTTPSAAERDGFTFGNTTDYYAVYSQNPDAANLDARHRNEAAAVTASHDAQVAGVKTETAEKIGSLKNEKLFEALYDGIEEDVEKKALPRLRQHAQALKARAEKTLADQDATPQAKTDAQVDLAVARGMLRKLDEPKPLGVKTDGGSLALAYLRSSWSVGAGAQFSLEGVNDWVDEHVKLGLGAARASDGSVIPGAYAGLAFGSAGENLGYGLAFGTVNGVAYSASVDGRAYLFQNADKRAALGDEAEARHSAGPVAAGAVTAYGGYMGMAGLQYGLEHLEGVEYQTRFLAAAVSELARAMGKPRTQEENIVPDTLAALDAVTVADVPSIAKLAPKDWEKLGIKDPKKWLDNLRGALKASLAQPEHAWDDRMSEKAKSVCLTSARQQVATIKYEDFLAQKDGWNFGGAGVGLAVAGVGPLTLAFPVVFAKMEVVGGKLVPRKNVDVERLMHHVDEQGKRVGLEEVDARALRERFHVTAEVRDVVRKGEKQGERTVLAYQGGTNETVRVLHAQDTKDKFRLSQKEVPVVLANGKPGVETAWELALDAGVKAVGVYVNTAGMGEDARRDVVFILEPSVKTPLTTEGRGGGNVPAQASAKIPQLLAGGFTQSNEVVGTNSVWGVIGGTDKGRREDDDNNGKVTTTPGDKDGDPAGPGTTTTTGGGTPSTPPVPPVTPGDNPAGI